MSVLYSIELNEREEDDGEAGVIIEPLDIEVGEEKVEEVKLEESVSKPDPNSPEHYKIEDRQDEEDENPYSGNGVLASQNQVNDYLSRNSIMSDDGILSNYSKKT